MADAYYASGKVILPLLGSGGHHLLTRARSNAVAFLPCPPALAPRRGRPRRYGTKVRLKDLLFRHPGEFVSAPSPVYGENNVTLHFRCLDLLWRPIGHLVRFVLVEHPRRSWLRTMNPQLAPSELVIAHALRADLPLLFTDCANDPTLKKFLDDYRRQNDAADLAEKAA